MALVKGKWSVVTKFHYSISSMIIFNCTYVIFYLHNWERAGIWIGESLERDKVKRTRKISSPKFPNVTKWVGIISVMQWIVQSNATWQNVWVKVFKNGPSKICGRQHLKILKWYGLLRQNFLKVHFFKGVLHKFYLVHSWIPWPIFSSVFDTVNFRLNKSVCNFGSMKSPAELNSLFSKFFCYIIWSVISLD